MILNRMGGIVLSHGTAISGNPLTSVAHGQPTLGQTASGDGPYPAAGDRHVGADRPCHGVQCERDRRGESLSRFGLLSQAASRMVRVWVLTPAPDLADRLHAVEKTVDPNPGLHNGLVGHGVDSITWRDGKGRPPLAAIGTDFDSAGRAREAGRGDLSRGLPDEERREDHGLSRRTAAGV